MIPFPNVLTVSSAPCSWNAANAQGSITSVGGTNDDVATFIQTQSGEADAAGAVIGTLSRLSAKRYFEIEMTGLIPTGGNPVGIGWAFGVSQQQNASNAYRFGGSGYGVSLGVNETPKPWQFGAGDADTGSSASGTITPASNHIGMMLVDFTENVAYFGIDGTWVVGDPRAGAGGLSVLHTSYFPCFYCIFGTYGPQIAAQTWGEITATLIAGPSAEAFNYPLLPGVSPWAA